MSFVVAPRDGWQCAAEYGGSSTAGREEIDHRRDAETAETEKSGTEEIGRIGEGTERSGFVASRFRGFVWRRLTRAGLHELGQMLPRGAG